MTNMYKDVPTWNPLAGKCRHNCKYCYVKSFWLSGLKKKYSGEYRIEWPRTDPPKGDVFLCSCNDLFEDSVRGDVLWRILSVVAAHSHHTRWMIQTKNPERMARYFDSPDGAHFDRSSWYYPSGLPWYLRYFTPPTLGTTIETDYQYRALKISRAPTTTSRLWQIASLRARGFRTYITVEPIMRFSRYFADKIIAANPSFVYIGADSKRHGLPEPTAGQVQDFIARLAFAGIEVRQKENLNRLLWPDGGKS